MEGVNPVKVTLSPELEQYLVNKHKEAIEVYAEKTYSTMLEPLTHIEIKMGIPDKKVADQFTMIEIDGFKVYIESDLVTDESEVKLHLEKHLLTKSIEVDGVSL